MQKIPTLKPRLQTMEPRRLPMAGKAGSTERPRGRIWQEARQVVMVRDGYRCRQCGSIDVRHEIDHIVPLEAGGSALGLGNLQTLCKACHAEKTASEAGLRAGKP